MAKITKTPNIKPVEKPEITKIIKEADFKYWGYTFTITKWLFGDKYRIYLRHVSRAERTKLDKSFETYEEAEEYLYRYIDDLPKS